MTWCSTASSCGREGVARAKRHADAQMPRGRRHRRGIWRLHGLAGRHLHGGATGNIELLPAEGSAPKKLDLPRSRSFAASFLRLWRRRVFRSAMGRFCHEGVPGMSGGAKSVLVTGGSRGIGAAICRLARDAGYRVAVNYASNAEAAEKLVAEIAGDRRRGLCDEGRCRQRADVLAMFAAVDAPSGRWMRWSTMPASSIVKARVDEMALSRLERMMRINVIGSMLCAREAVKRMSTRHGGKGGAIVNVSSVAAPRGAGRICRLCRLERCDRYLHRRPFQGSGHRRHPRQCRAAGHHRYRNPCVRRPAGSDERDERHVPMKRGGTADEVAQTILWLLSDEASYTTGAMVS